VAEADAMVRVEGWSEVQWFRAEEAVATVVSAAVVRPSPLRTRRKLGLLRLDWLSRLEMAEVSESRGQWRF